MVDSFVGISVTLNLVGLLTVFLETSIALRLIFTPYLATWNSVPIPLSCRTRFDSVSNDEVPASKE
jgi:hypothetical protein